MQLLPENYFRMELVELLITSYWEWLLRAATASTSLTSVLVFVAYVIRNFQMVVINHLILPRPL